MNEIEAVGAESLLTPRTPGGTAAEKERPWLYSLLIAPSAVMMNGVVQGGALAYLLSEQGVKSGQQAHIIQILALPTSLYFLWSPITDFLVRRRTWLLIGSLMAGLLMAAAFHQKSLTSTTVLVLIFLSACFSQLVVSSCGGMMGVIRLERSRRVASSFYQAGSMAFGAAAASVMIAASSRVSQTTVGLIAAALIALPGFFCVGSAGAGSDRRKCVRRGDEEGLARSSKRRFWRWDAAPYTAVMVFPMASGAAVSLLTGVARDYRVHGDSVAWMNGFFGTLLMAAGALAATRVSARIRAAVAYLSMSLVNAAALMVLWLGPLRPSTYYVGVTLYLFTVGSCYALFTAVVLEFLGDSGKSGSGRYSIINSLGNVPVLYMLRLDGRGADKWGARGLSGTEAVVGGVGAVLLLAYFLVRKGVGAGAKELSERGGGLIGG